MDKFLSKIEHVNIDRIIAINSAWFNTVTVEEVPTVEAYVNVMPEPDRLSFAKACMSQIMYHKMRLG